ncbi:MAG: type II toxin-antitoxin system RelE/ParE family toxin [Candidatus Nanoarchaeia archaeon]
MYSKSLKYEHVRKFAYKNYSIFYTIKEDTIFIITIVHQSRNVEL